MATPNGEESAQRKRGDKVPVSFQKISYGYDSSYRGANPKEKVHFVSDPTTIRIARDEQASRERRR